MPFKEFPAFELRLPGVIWLLVNDCLAAAAWLVRMGAVEVTQMAAVVPFGLAQVLVQEIWADQLFAEWLELPSGSS